jgi:hypothetical protein
MIFSAAVLPWQAEKADQNSGGVGSPDMSLFYSAEDLYTLAESYGENGRTAYIQARVTFDIIFPLVYTAFLATSISWVFSRIITEDSKWQLAGTVPVMGMVFDFLENGAVSLVMARYPDSTPIIVSLAPILTLLKWVFVSGSFVLLFGGIILGIWNWIARSSR